MRTVAMKMAKRVARTAMVLALAAGSTSCIDDVTPPQREGIAAQTGAIRLYLSNQPVMTIYEDGKVTLGPIVFLRTSLTLDEVLPIRAELLDRQGNVIPNVSPDDVRINIGTSSGNLDFLRDDAFSGGLRSESNTLPATYDVLVGLYDLNQRRVALGPYTVRLVARLP